MSNRPATWKVVTFGAALAGLGVAGAGAAVADDLDRAVPAGGRYHGRFTRLTAGGARP